MKAVPQFHNGIIYRSRTEARWAEFWTLAGIPFEYEPEGFDLDGEWYVPDFRIGGKVYFEVKGIFPNERERRVAQKLADASECPVVIADGNPGSSRLVAYGIGDLPSSCVIVEEFKSDGAWIAEFADGGGWALPLCPALVNCSATGNPHPLLIEAGWFQFKAPVPGTEFASIGDVVGNLVRRLMASKGHGR